MVATAVLGNEQGNHLQNLRGKCREDQLDVATARSKQVDVCFQALSAFHADVKRREVDTQGNLVKGFAKTEKEPLSKASQTTLTVGDAKTHKVAQGKIAPQKMLSSPFMPSKPANQLVSKYDTNPQKKLLGDVAKLAATTEAETSPSTSTTVVENTTRSEELSRFCQERSIRNQLIGEIFANVIDKIAMENAFRRLRGLSAPVLELPSVELVAEMLYCNGIKADAVDDALSQQDLNEIEKASEKIHAKRLEDLKEKMAKEAQSFSWGTAIQVFSWVGSFLGILSGIALIATGAGAVAGAFLLAAGLLNLGSQILDVTGGWDKLTDLFPGDDLPEKKRAIRSWIQISITVLSVILGGIGGVISGFKELGPAMKFAGDLAAMGLLVGHSTTLIGKAVTDSKLKRQQAKLKEDDIELTRLEASREDATEKLERRFASYEQLTELLGKIFNLRHESFKVLMKTVK